jgi:hypothetical protein
MQAPAFDYQKTAQANVIDQTREHDGYGRSISLHGLWRHVGSPEGRDPQSWIHRASGFLVPYMRYLEDLIREEPDSYPFEGEPVVSLACAEDIALGSPYIRAGDLMAHQTVACMYAEYVQGDVCWSALEDVLKKSSRGLSLDDLRPSGN